MAKEVPAFLRAEIGNDATDPVQEPQPGRAPSPKVKDRWTPALRRCRLCTTSPPDTEASSLYCNCRSGLGADDLVVPAIKQALSMLGQAREALIFAQCPTAVQAIKSTLGALRTAKRRVQVASSGLGQFGQFFFFSLEPVFGNPLPRLDANLGVIEPYSHTIGGCP
jgi:hypothetical protein